MNSLYLGTSTRDITPPYPVWAHGYSGRQRPSAGVLEPLTLGCLAIGRASTRILIVTLDMIGVHADVCEELYALLEEETGVGFPNIMIAASHTHFAPALHLTTFTDPEIALVEPDPEYVRQVKTRLVEAAREALDHMCPTQLETVRRPAPQVLFNRRTLRREDGSVRTSFLYPEDPSPYRFSAVDSELTTLRFVDDHGVRAVLLNFGCHPVTGGPEEDDTFKFSADYPHYARQTIADQWHCPVFFTLGAAGDAVPINRRGDCRQRLGSVLGNTALLAERMYAADASADLEAGAVQVEVATILETDAAAASAAYEETRRAALALGDRQSDAYQQAVATFQQKMTAHFRARLYPENQGQIKVQFIRVGRTVLVGLPFEVLAEISLQMKQRFPDSVLFSCTGGYQGYLPLAHEYERGGYEATADSTHFVPGTGDRLLQVILQELEERNARGNDP